MTNSIISKSNNIWIVQVIQIEELLSDVKGLKTVFAPNNIFAVSVTITSALNTNYKLYIETYITFLMIATRKV